jgi:hypothetical protein
MQREVVMYNIQVREYSSRRNEYVPTHVEWNVTSSENMFPKFFKKWKSEYEADNGDYQVLLMDEDDENVIDSFFCNDIDFI